MAGGIDLGGGGRRGKKPLDAVINLVPFIDLMAVTIAFLLITAVWTQAGVQPVATSGPGTDAAETSEALTLTVTDQTVTLDGAPPIPVSELQRLEKHLLERQAHLATLVVDDSVSYDTLVHVIDVCRGVHVDVTVSPGSG